jgi:glycosyltransferase involved in cell wall biosynthesis
MNMDTPLVSVCLISYNQRRYIGQALESVLMQAGDFPIEIVVGDDSSDDGTIQALHGYGMQTAGKVRLLPVDRHRGLSGNILRTLEACRGRYVAIIEGDDYWTSPRKLARQVGLMEAHPETAVCFHDALKISENHGMPSNFVPDGQKEVSGLDDLLAWNFIPSSSVVYRRQQSLPYPISFVPLPMSGWPMHALHAQFGSIRYIDDVMSVYRLHAGSAWSSSSWRVQTEGVFRALDVMNRHFSIGVANRTVMAREKLLGDRIRESTVLMNLRDYEKASVMLDDVLSFEPDLHEIRLARAYALVQLGRLKESARELEELIRRSPDHAGAIAMREKICCEA